MSIAVHEPIAFVRRSVSPTEVMLVLRPEEEGCFSDSAIADIAGLSEVESASSLSPGGFPCTNVQIKVGCPSSFPKVIDKAQEILSAGFVTHRTWQLMDEGPDA